MAALMILTSAVVADTTLRVGVYDNEPKIFETAQGRPSGIFIDLLEGIANTQDWTLEYVRCEWQRCLADLEAGRLDLLPDVALTPQRRDRLDFHRQAALHSWSQLYSRRGADLVSVFQLDGKRVAVLEGAVQQAEFLSMMDDFGIDVTVVGVRHYDQAFAQLQRGEVDVAVVNYQYGAYRAVDFGLQLTPIVFQPVSLYFAATPGRHAEVLEAIDLQLSVWLQSPQSYYFSVIDRWQPEPPRQLLPIYAWLGLALLTALLGLFVAASLWLRQQVERKTRDLVHSEQKLNTILDSVGAYVFIKDTELRYQYVNRPFRERIRSSGAEMLGKRDDEVFGERVAALLSKNDQKVLQEGRSVTIEENLPAQPGDAPRTYLSVKIPLRNDASEVYGLCGISTDITDRKQAEESRRLAATVFQSQEAMLIADASRTILDANRAFCDLTGFSERVLRHRRLDNLASRRQDGAFYQAVWNAVSRNGHWQGHLWLRHRRGHDIPVRMMVSAVTDASDKISHYVLTLQDVAEEIAYQQRISKLAFTDTLTGLSNRHALLDRLNVLDKHQPDSGLALLILDVDNFKDINDILGHEQGDAMLQEIASRLNRSMQPDDRIVRLASDEFAVLREHASAIHFATFQEQMLALCHVAKQALEEEYRLGNDRYRCSVTVGLALWQPGQDIRPGHLMKQADLALHQAKESESRSIQLYTPALQMAIRARYDLEVELRKAIERNEFCLMYQPQVDEKGLPCGVEALIRWQHPDRGLISPAEFIPIAERSGLIVPLGRWVISEACRQLIAWSEDESMASMSCAVNVSARQFRSVDFVDHLSSVLSDTGVDPKRLKIELTETLLIDDIDSAVEKISALNQLGVQVSLDDFGTGYSSLSYLKRLPLNQLKIDQTFVCDVLHDNTAAMIARSIIGLGESLELEVIAEGVETNEQYEWLKQAGCHAYQGYLFTRPVDAEAVREWVVSQPVYTA
ncbi:MAG: EAL domain-containing protein [Saccharospirillum sp.]